MDGFELKNGERIGVVLMWGCYENAAAYSFLDRDNLDQSVKLNSKYIPKYPNNIP